MRLLLGRDFRPYMDYSDFWNALDFKFDLVRSLVVSYPVASVVFSGESFRAIFFSKYLVSAEIRPSCF